MLNIFTEKLPIIKKKLQQTAEVLGNIFKLPVSASHYQKLVIPSWLIISTVLIIVPTTTFSWGLLKNNLVLAFLNFASLYLLCQHLVRIKSPLFINRKILLTALLGILLLGSAKYLLGINPLYLPLPAVLLTLLVICQDIGALLLIMVYLSFFAAAIFNYSASYFTIFMFGAACALTAGGELSDRALLTKAGIWSAIGSVIGFIAIYLIDPDFAAKYTLADTWTVALVSLLSLIFVLGSLPYLGKTFELLTSIQLMELASANNPLLKRLSMEAPGTYQHSLIVANLAEAAIEATKGNPMLARVGGYFHDIGKLVRPYFFIENQSILENPHDLLNPKLSSLIISAHTKEGVELAKKYNTPRAVLDIIEQHHGTSVISYFYKTFLEENKLPTSNHETLSADDFRYPGPKPQTTEAAVVMLADTCEAAVRTLEKPSPAKINVLVEKLIKDKVASGQLDQCDFTFNDLTKIKNTFTRIFSSALHGRIKYQEDTPKL